MRAGLLLLGLLLAASCGESEPETLRIALRSPQALDPSLVSTVRIAVVREPSQRCVVSAGSNLCAELRDLQAAASSQGFLGQTSLTAASGSSTALFEDLPRARVCFVAEALSATGAQLASGCAEVWLHADRHRIEIELQER